MTAMVSVALAVIVTASLALAVSQHLDARVGEMSSRASIAVSGLGLESVGTAHAILYGTVANDGTEAVRLDSITILAPSAGSCAPTECSLGAPLRREGGTPCTLGGGSTPCALLPGESISLGPSVHALHVSPPARYVITVSAVPDSGGSIVHTAGVQAR